MSQVSVIATMPRSCSWMWSNMSVVLLRTDLALIRLADSMLVLLELGCRGVVVKIALARRLAGRLPITVEMRVDVDVDVRLSSHAWLVALQLCQVHVWCSRYEEASVTNWDLSTGQAGVNDRHCMYRRLGQARPCNATLTDARRWTGR